MKNLAVCSLMTFFAAYSPLTFAYTHCNGGDYSGSVEEQAEQYSRQTNCGGGGSIWSWKNCTADIISASLRNSSGAQVCGAGQVPSGSDVKTLAYCPGGELDAQHRSKFSVQINSFGPGNAVKVSQTGNHIYSSASDPGASNCSAGETVGGAFAGIADGAGGTMGG